MDKERYQRLKDADWHGKEQTITVGGAGSIGSHFLFQTLKTNDHVIHLYDFDTLEEHNLGGQLFLHKDVGQLKTVAITSFIGAVNGESPVIMDFGKFIKDSPVNPICVSGFDNMEARKLMFEEWCKLENKEVFIDGRMSFEAWQLYTVYPKDIEEYRKTLFDDSELPDLQCTMKSTTPIASSLGSIMALVINNHISNKLDEFDGREVPFKLELNAKLLNNGLTN